MTAPVVAIGTTTLEKLHVLAAPGCDCQSCVFIRQAYQCHCSVCGLGWQAAFATPDAAREGMEAHTQACRARMAARMRPLRLRRLPEFATVREAHRFLRDHCRGFARALSLTGH